MSKNKDLKNRIKFLKDKLTLMNVYKAEYQFILGKKGYFDEIDLTLDELKILIEKYKKFEEDEK